jgi:putative spermidine/putrescine transport system permease protein
MKNATSHFHQDKLTSADSHMDARSWNALERRKQFELASLMLPAAIWIGIVLLVPLAQLLWLSLLDDTGHLSLHNYMSMWQPLYSKGLLTTIVLSTLVAVGAAILGYPLCYLMCHLSPRGRAICLAFVLLPFWTSTLVRTFSWLVILQRRGIINSALMRLGILNEPLHLVNNFAGTTIGLIHIMLPFFILPLYSGMRNLNMDCIKAAASCGASPTRAFWQVFFPLTLPSVGAATALVFVMCLGFYITPALLGGGKVLMWSMLIESALTINPNRGGASALGVALVVATTLILVLMRRVARKCGSSTGGIQ